MCSFKINAECCRKCALLGTPRQCFYRMNIGEPETWYCISQICRNRVSKRYKINL